MSPHLLRLGLISFGVALACRPAEHRSDERAALMNADRRFASATASRRLEGWVASFAPDGKMVTRSGTIEGPDAIRAYMGPFFADTSARLTWEPRSAEAAAAADLGYTVGRYEATRLTPTGPRRETGSYVTVWRRGTDGTWLVALDIGSPDQ